MADSGLFIGWGPPVRGREANGLEVFSEALAYYENLQKAGTIESHEVVLIGPHGGDLHGFALLRGSEDDIATVRVDDAFQRLIARAGVIVERLGVVDAAVGDGVAEAVSRYRQAVGELA